MGLGIAGMTNRAQCVQNREKTRLSSDGNSIPAEMTEGWLPIVGDKRRSSGPTSDREETWLPRSDAAGVRERCCCYRWRWAPQWPPITTPPVLNWVAAFFSRSVSDVRARRPGRERTCAKRHRPVPGAIVAATRRLSPIDSSARHGCRAPWQGAVFPFRRRDAGRGSRRSGSRRVPVRHP